MGYESYDSIIVYSEFEASDYISVRLEVIEYYYAENSRDFDDAREYVEFEDQYQVWAIRFFVKGIDDNHIKNIDDDLITAFPQNPIIGRDESERYVKEPPPSSIETQFKNTCLKIRKWVEKDYDPEQLEYNLCFPLLKKILDAGDKSAVRILNEKIILKENLNILKWLLNEGILVYVYKDKMNRILESKLIKNIIVDFRDVRLFFIEAYALIEVEELIGKKLLSKPPDHYFPDYYFDYKGKNYWVNKDHVIGLDLQYRDLRFLPESIGNLIYLEYLNLYGTILKSLPESFGNLSSLKILDMDNIDREFWPDNLPNDAKKVVEYYLLKREGKIEKIVFKGQEFDVINGFLDLSGLPIKKVDELEGFKDLINIKRLRLSSYSNRFEGMKKLAPQFLKIALQKKPFIFEIKIKDLPLFKNMEILQIPSVGLTDMEGIERFENLRELDLSHNQITEIKNLENLKKLEILNLDGNPFEDLKGLENLCNLEELYIDNKELSEIKDLDYLIHLKELKFAQTYVDYCRMKKELGLTVLPIKEYFRIKQDSGYGNLLIQDEKAINQAISYYDGELNLRKKAISYNDWELNFRKKAVLTPNSRNKAEKKNSQEKINSLGLSDNAYKDFMKKWKSENEKKENEERLKKYFHYEKKPKE